MCLIGFLHKTLILWWLCVSTSFFLLTSHLSFPLSHPFRNSSVTHMTPGQTSTPILRTTLNHSEVQPPQQQQQQQQQYYQQQQPPHYTNGSSPAAAALAADASAPAAPDAMQQVNLASPPPFDAAAMRKAEFY